MQGIEVANGLDYYPESFGWVHEKNLAPLADSDAHSPISIDYARRQRPVTLVFAKTADAAGIREALFARRTAAWMGGQIWGPEAMLQGLWQNGIQILTPAVSSRAMAVAVENRCAFPFQVRVVRSPAWLRLRVSDLTAERITGWRIEVAKDAPAAETTAEVELEITNLHTQPGRNLNVKVPLKIALE